MEDFGIIIREFCAENDISLNLSYDMPVGYETAYGTYDVTINTLFLNAELLKNAPRYEVLFYLFHELRHAMQYLCPSLFSDQIQQSRFYVVLYNGVCYKLIDNEWQECTLDGSEEYFTCVYMSLPYEIDANSFAYEKTKEICGDTAELQELYSYWMPKNRVSYEEYTRLFRRIDKGLKISAHLAYKILLSENDVDVPGLLSIYKMPGVSQFLSIGDNYFHYVSNTENVYFYKVYEDDDLVGILHIEKNDTVLHVGVLVFPEFQRRGFATRVIKDIQNDVLGLNYKRIEISIDESNIASLKLFESVGFTFVSKEDELVNFVYEK